MIGIGGRNRRQRRKSLEVSASGGCLTKKNNSMTELCLITSEGQEIRFSFYDREAPVTCKSIKDILPIDIKLFHARTSGEEIWSPDGPELTIIQENATINIEPGEIGIAPIHPRNRIAKCLVITYGTAKLFDCANIFGKVIKEDEERLKQLGNKIWLEGAQVVNLRLKER